MSGDQAPTVRLLHRRTSTDGQLRIATLSWDLDGAPERIVSSDAFQAVLAEAPRELSEGIDLVVCAGCRVESAVLSEDVLRATGSVPVLFEVSQDRLRPWTLVCQENGSAETFILRREQLVERFDQLREMSALAAVVAGGGGMFRFEGFDATLLLLICGENNAVARGEGRSVLREITTRDQERTRLRMLRRWVLINPAHVPYWPQIRSTGFCKVGRDSRGAGPTLKHIVGQAFAYDDGTHAPLAVIHCNNFYESRIPTKQYASLAFDGPRCRVASSVLPKSTETARWLWALHTLSISPES